MEEINLYDLLKYLKEKWLLIACSVVLFFVLGTFYYNVLLTPEYTSSTTLILVSSNTESNSTISQTDLTINQKLVKTYQQIIQSRKVLSKVIEELGLDISWEELKSDINVSNVSDTEIIRIAVTNESPRVAYQVANSVANVFSEEVVEYFNLSNVSILDKAVRSDVPSSMNLTKTLAIFVAAGLVLSLAIIFVLFYFDTTIKSAEQIEAKIDVPVLGSIPNYSEKLKNKKDKNNVDKGEK